MSVNVAQMMVTVGANTAMAEQGIMGLARMLGPTGLLAIGAVGAGLAVAGIGAAAIHMAGDFQTGMTSIVTGAGESQSNLQLISDGVLQMARDTGTTTKQLTDGLYMIESGGYHGAAGLAILQAAAEGAKVGQADLGVVADATDTVLKNFGDTGLTATQAVNTLITTVANGKTHMQDLADALSHILPTAAAAHVGLSDVMGAMATMTGEGVDAANAATYLRQMMIALMAPSSASEQALAKVGLTTTQVANEMHTSLPGAVAMITEAIGKKFPEGSAGYMQAIRDISGGSRQMQGMLLLSGQHMETFNRDVVKIGASASATGDTINGWALVQGTFNQQMSKLGEIFQTLMIQLGQQFLPLVTQAAKGLADGLNGLVGAFKALQQPAQTVMLTASGLRTGARGLSSDLGGLTASIRAPLTPLQQLTGMFSQLQGWALSLRPEITKVSAGFGAELLGAATQVATFAQQTLLPAFEQFGAFFVNTILPILRTFADVLIKNVLPAILPVVKTIVEKWLPPLERIMKDILPVLNPLLQALGWLFQNVIGPGLNMAAQAVGGMLNGIADLIDGITKFVHNPSVNNMIGIMKDIANAGTSATNLMTGGFFHSVLPHFAAGGTMDTSGLALVGEAGPELVTLPGGAQVTPLAQFGTGSGGLAPGGGYGAGGGMTVVNLQLQAQLTADGRKIAQVVVPHIHTIVRNATGQRGM